MQPRESVGDRRAAVGVPGVQGVAGEVLGLQRRIGNRAVTRRLLRDTTPVPPGTPALAGRPQPLDPPAPGVQDPERKKQLDAELVAAVGRRDWVRAAQILNSFDAADITPRLWQFSEDGLRRIDDADVRAQSDWERARGVPLKVHNAIVRQIRDRGITGGHADTGAAYGRLEIDWGKVERNPEGTGGEFRAENKGQKMRIDADIRITFTPVPSLVKADEIGFIQTVRVVDRKTGENRDPERAIQNRHTVTHSGIDRFAGKTQGWYGLEDDETAASTVEPWKRATPDDPAVMYDKPGAALTDVRWEFETAAVSRVGPDRGTVYAVVSWGMEVDDQLGVTFLVPRIFNKVTADFEAAVAKWNEQAVGPKEQRNAVGQAPLPTLQ